MILCRLKTLKLVSSRFAVSSSGVPPLEVNTPPTRLISQRAIELSCTRVKQIISKRSTPTVFTSLHIISRIASRVVCIASLVALFITPFVMTPDADGAPLTVHNETFHLRPQLWLSSVYDDNVFYESEREPTGNLPNSGALVKTGLRLSLKNRKQKSVSFNLDLSSAYRHYVYLDDLNNKGSSELDRLRQGRSGFDYARAEAGLILGSQSDIQLQISERFNYVERPAYENTIYGFERVDNRLRAAIDWAPGRQRGGGPLGINLAYGLQNISFLNDGEGLPIQGRSEKQGQMISLDSRWRFLPKNFLTLNMSYALSNDYNDFEQDEDDESAEAASRDSNPLRLQLGLTGLITRRISVFFQGGYSNTFNKSGNSFTGFIGLFQLTYSYTPKFDLSVGYQRDGSDSGFSNFYTLNRVYAKSNIRFSNQWTLGGNLSYDIYDYDTSNAVDDTGRYDPVLRARITLSMQLPGHFSVQLAYSIEANYSEYQLPINDPVDRTDYQRQILSLALYFN